MDLSSIRQALNEFSGATPVYPSDLRSSTGVGAFLLGEHARILPAQAPSPIDRALNLDEAGQWQPDLLEDFTQSDALEIDYPCGQTPPDVTLFYNVAASATEVRLDGVTVAFVQMRAGHGPLRASAIRLIPDLGLAADIAAQ